MRPSISWVGRTSVAETALLAVGGAVRPGSTGSPDGHNEPASTTDVADVEGELSGTDDVGSQSKDAGDASDVDELILEDLVARREDEGQVVTGTMVADFLGASLSTGRRGAALRKVRQSHLLLAGNE